MTPYRAGFVLNSVLACVYQPIIPLVIRWLPRKDSNLVKENQNLLCYRYTTGQNTGSSECPARIRTLTKRIKISCATITPRGRSGGIS
jgi:hypothetical protein